MSSFIEVEVGSDVIARAQRGDRAAHQAIYLAYRGPVHRLIHRIVGSTALADELLHDVFIEVLTNCSHFRGEGPLGAWVRRIAVRKCLMQIRSPWFRLRATTESRVPHHDDGAAEAADLRCESALLTQIEVERAFARLDPVARAVVWLHDVEGHTHGEIAELFGRTPSFSKSQLARAHARLRNALTPEEEATDACTQPSTIC